MLPRPYMVYIVLLKYRYLWASNATLYQDPDRQLHLNPVRCTYTHLSFPLSTLPPVKIRIISHFINFFPLLSVTTYFHYPDTIRCTVIISVIYLSGYSENKLPTTSLLYLCAKKNQPIISNSTRVGGTSTCPLCASPCLVCYR